MRKECFNSVHSCPQIETLKPNNSGLLLSYEAIRSRAGVISVQQKFKTAERGERVRSFSKAVDTAVQSINNYYNLLTSLYRFKRFTPSLS